MTLSNKQRIGLSLLPSRQQRLLREQFLATNTLHGSILEDVCKAFESRITRDLQYCLDNAISLVCCMDDDYPELLHHIPDFPLMLYAKGHVDCLHETTCFGIVGTRHATPYGLEAAKSMASELAQQGIIIVSGLAQGIDGAAHTGAINSGKTIAVIGTGINVCFPSSHQSLMNKIVQTGCIRSVLPVDSCGSKRTRPLRNRIIAGLSRGVLVVESQAHGGSLITARLALEYNRDVFALPGRINESTSQGTLQLIRDGAVLVRNVDDILSELQWLRTPTTPSTVALSQTNFSDQEKLVLRYLSSQSSSLDSLSAKIDLDSNQLISTLSQLEIKGALIVEPGGYYRKAKS